MNLLLFFGFILIISRAGESSVLLTTEESVGGGHKNNESGTLITANDDQLSTRGGQPYELTFNVECVCPGGPGESYGDLYIVGEVLYLSGHGDSAPIRARKQFTSKQKVFDDSLSAQFQDFAEVNDEPDKGKIGVYIELWDEDNVGEPDFLGSWTMKRDNVAYPIDRTTKSKLKTEKGINYKDRAPEALEKCKINDVYHCGDKSASAKFHASSHSGFQ